MNEDTEIHGNYLWLSSLIATAAVVALTLSFHLVRTAHSNDSYTFAQSLLDLTEALIPNLVAGLVAFLLLYWFFERRGLVPSQLDRKASEDRIVGSISAALVTSNATQGVRAMYPSFKQVDWTALINESNLRIDLVVNYFDSWIKDNEKSLIDFFKKPEAEMHLYIPDESDNNLIQQLQALYTEYSAVVMQEKIRNTEVRIQSVMTAAGARKSQLRVYRLNRRPTYALQRLDNRLAVFSAFDNGRKMGVECPSVVFDLQKLPTVAAYFEAELQFLAKQSNV